MIRILATLLGVVAAAVAAVGLGVRYVPLGRHSTVLLATAAPYLMLAAPVAVLLLLLSRRWVLAAPAVALTVAIAVIHVPLYIGHREAAAVASVQLRVLTSNLGMGQGDPAAVVELAERGADVVVLQELTQEAADGLAAAGLDKVFGHRIINPAPMAGGIGIWSRFPLADTAHVPGYSLAMVRARVQVPGVAEAPIVVGLHFAAPWPAPIDGWRTDMDKFPGMLRGLSEEAGAAAVIVAGDFNATAEMLPFRELLATGYRDAGEQAGAGLVRTFPAHRLLPVAGLDHLLIRNADASTVVRQLIPGADHLAVIATVELPGG